MALTPEEQKTLDELLAKQETGNVMRLIPGGKQNATPIVERLRGILKDAESGRYEAFVFVGTLVGNDHDADLRWETQGNGMSFKLWGAITRALNYLHGQG